MSIQSQNKYILPTPAGAYYCIAAKETDPAKQFLQKLMMEKQTVQLDAETLNHLFADNIHDQQQILHHIHNLKWLQGFDQTKEVPAGTIEQALPEILHPLSSDGKALLADDQGLYLASTGFTHEASEELSALSGDLSSLYARHQGIIKGNLNINSSAFSIVDAAGYSQLGFWPIHIGDLMFVLVISGAPRFDQPAFVNLVWSLHKRYFTYNTAADSDAA